MDFDSYIMSTGHTDDEIAKINQTIVNVTNQVTSGIKSITQQNGNQLVFTLNDNTIIKLTVTGLSSNDYTTTEKSKLASLDSNMLNLFTYVNGDLLFNGNKVENNKLDLSNYYTQTQINTLLGNKANSVHNHNISEILNLQTELSNRYTKLETLSKTEIETLVNSISKGMNWKESIDTESNLPMTENSVSDARIIQDTSTIVIWNGTTWISLGSSANIPLATETLDGQMSKEDKAKLNSIILENLVTYSGGNITINGDIVPSTNGIQNIGSPTNRFSTIYVNEAKLSTNTLYIGDTPVLGTNQDTVMVKADLDQSLTVKTIGVGTTKVISESGVELSTSGMNANVNLQATGSGSNTNISSTNQVNMTAPNVNISGSTNVTGGISVDNLTIRGNVAMQGQTFDVEATTVRVEDNIIELNKNEVGYGVTSGRAGLKINRGDADDMLLVFDETDDTFKVGNDLALKSLATQEYVNSNATKVEKSTTNGNVLINGVETTVYTVNDDMLNLTPITTVQRNALTGLNACTIVFDSDIGAVMCYDGSAWYQL